MMISPSEAAITCRLAIMTDALKVDFGKMDELVNSIARANGSIHDALARLESQVATLKSIWTGDATLAYDRAQTAWTADLSVLNRVLGDIRTMTDEANQRYSDTEREVGNLWG